MQTITARQTLPTFAGALATRCLALSTLLLGSAVVAAAPTPSSVSSEANSQNDPQIRIRVIDAKLPMVLETLARNAGLEARIDTPVSRNPATVSGALSGSSTAELRRIAQSHDLALFIDGNIAWIDDINKRHSATIMSSRDVAARVYDLLVAEPVVDEGLVRQSQGTLQLTGTRAFVQLTTRHASSIIDSMTAETANTRVLDEPVTQEDTVAKDIASTPDPKQPELPVVVQPSPPAPSIAPTATPTKRIIRSITDVPGFDTDYTE